jgi:hypothetical protein
MVKVQLIPGSKGLFTMQVVPKPVKSLVRAKALVRNKGSSPALVKVKTWTPLALPRYAVPKFNELVESWSPGPEVGIDATAVEALWLFPDNLAGPQF